MVARASRNALAATNYYCPGGRPRCSDCGVALCTVRHRLLRRRPHPSVWRHRVRALLFPAQESAAACAAPGTVVVRPILMASQLTAPAPPRKSVFGDPPQDVVGDALRQTKRSPGRRRLRPGLRGTVQGYCPTYVSDSQTDSDCVHTSKMRRRTASGTGRPRSASPHARTVTHARSAASISRKRASKQRQRRRARLVSASSGARSIRGGDVSSLGSREPWNRIPAVRAAR